MRPVLGAILLAALVAGCVTGGDLRAPALQSMLRPHDAVYRPDGDGPFPAILVLHGCFGVRGKDRRWAQALRDQGYVALVVDSMTGRGLTTADQLRGVCQGLRLWGGTRAADVAASLAHLRTLPYVDATRLGVIGFSHGAWAALDFLAVASDDDVRGLHAVVGFYPYCGVASLARWRGWQVDVPTLLLLAADDRVVSPAQCETLASRVTAEGKRLSLTVYPDVGHAFDWRTSTASDDARSKVTTFLAEHLGAPRPRHAEARGR